MGWQQVKQLLQMAYSRHKTIFVLVRSTMSTSDRLWFLSVPIHQPPRLDCLRGSLVWGGRHVALDVIQRHLTSKCLPAITQQNDVIILGQHLHLGTVVFASWAYSLQGCMCWCP